MTPPAKKKLFCQKCSNPIRALHNAKWMVNSGRVPICYQAIDMPVEFRHVVIYEDGAEDYARKDPHWSEHTFEPVSIAQLEELVAQVDEIFKNRPSMQEVMPERGLCIRDTFELIDPETAP